MVPPPIDDRAVRFLQEQIVKKIKTGDAVGVRELADEYGMPYRLDHLKEALRAGQIDVVKLLIISGVPTTYSLHECLMAPRENVEILKFLIQQGAPLDYQTIPRAIRLGYLDSACLLLAYDKSSSLWRFAAYRLGGMADGHELVENLCALVHPKFRRDVIEIAMLGAVSGNNPSELARLRDLGGSGDRIVWNGREQTLQDRELVADNLRNACVQVPISARFPLLVREAEIAPSYRVAIDKLLCTFLLDSAVTAPLQIFEPKRGKSFWCAGKTASTKAAPAQEIQGSDGPSRSVEARRLQDAHTLSEPLMTTFGFPLVSSIIDACVVHNSDAFRAILDGNPAVLDPRFHILEQVIASGSLPLVKVLVDEYRADPQQHEGLPLSMAAHAGYVDIVEYVIARGANVRAHHDAALMEAARLSNAEVVRVLIKHGADPQAHRSKALYLCSQQSSNLKSKQALRAAKFLVDAGAIPESPCIIKPYMDETPACQYLHLMAAAVSPESPLCLKRLEPRLSDEYINFSLPRLASNPIFRFASSCAAVAARLDATIESPDLFVALFTRGASKVLDGKLGRFRDLADSVEADVDVFQDIDDLVDGALWDAIVPLLGAQTDKPTLEFESLILERKAELRNVVSRELFAERPLPEIFKLGVAWHRPDKRIPLDAQPLKQHAEWYPIMERTDLDNGYSVEALIDNAALQREGAIMHHCLGTGGYGTQCLLGETHVLSLKRFDEPCATIELRKVKKNFGEIEVRGERWLAFTQFFGAGNSEPDGEARSAFNNLRRMIHGREVALCEGAWGETVESAEARRRLGISKLETITGIRTGEFPTLALAHYSGTITVPTATRDASGRRTIVGLLDPQTVDRIMHHCKSVLENSFKNPRRAHEQDPPLAEVNLTKQPSSMRLLAWEFENELKRLRASCVGILSPNYLPRVPFSWNEQPNLRFKVGGKKLIAHPFLE